MHAMQGIFTHTSKTVRKHTKAVDSDGPWMQEVARVQNEAQECMKNQDSDWLKLHEASKEFDLEWAAVQQAKEAENCKTTPDQQRIAHFDVCMQELLRQKADHSRSTGYGASNQCRTGAAKVNDAIKSYVKMKKRPKGQAEYSFNRSIGLHENVLFRADHSGFKLTHKDGINVLEAWGKKVCHTTSAVYPNHPDLQA
jgi:hypothetical protein